MIQNRKQRSRFRKYVVTVYGSGSQTGRRETLPGAPRKLVKVVAFTAFLIKTAM